MSTSLIVFADSSRFLVRTGQRVDQRRLANARGADKCDRLPGLAPWPEYRHLVCVASIECFNK
jgi:hypothetical protein